MEEENTSMSLEGIITRLYDQGYAFYCPHCNYVLTRKEAITASQQEETECPKCSVLIV